MLIYMLRKFNLFIITLLILTIVGYSIMRLDPLSHWAQDNYWSGWLVYLRELLQLNFGVNHQGTPILDELKIVFPATLELCILSFTIALVVGIPLGTIAGMKQGKWIDTVVSFIAMCGYSAPIYWIALILIMVLSLNYQLFPVSGRYDLLYNIDHITGFTLIDVFLSHKDDRAQAIQSVIQHMIMPCVVLALSPTTQIIRLMRESVADVMSQNYIRVARIRGLSQYSIVREHVLRNAIPPIIPKFGFQLSTMFALAIITESIFNWPGIGRWLLDALAKEDYVSIQAGVIVVATVVLSANIISDLIGAIINPLVRKTWYAQQ
ncbi:ABC transporter permease [Vibrio viridaestus]|uniref:ABC transporter permease subunit n=1 Tax=Vibrio viridaestus TaxID=2487322 RepID=A0A3N9U1P0_9VIBR|nr:ABC transporter permease subunit [Vibrio viridaestus]RQW63422.1 ABC transporter permease subunit [Vibrio viridaestus]